MNYDVIVVGAGNAGLVSALTLQKMGKKVLVLEKGRVPGGVASSFKRGIFEFETSLQSLCGYGDATNPGDIYKLFERLGIASKIVLKEIEESFCMISMDSKEEFKMPTGVEEFILKMEEYVPGSQDAMVTFFGLCEDIKDAFITLKEQKESFHMDEFYQMYPNFVQVAPCNTKIVLEAIGVPRKAIQILSTICYFLGSPMIDLSFIHFALFVDSYIKYKPSMPTLTSHEISTMLEQEFISYGGVIKYLQTVEEILVEEKEVTGVRVGDTTIPCHQIICNINPVTVYGNMIKKESIPLEALKLQNKRTLGPKCCVVYLGLNKSPEELGLNSYHYVLFRSLDSQSEFKNMENLWNGNIEATVLNNGSRIASREGTTILMLRGIFFGDDFEKTVTKENYFEKKEEIGKYYIHCFEEATGVSILDAIEEIEIATPVTVARYSGAPDGVIYGFQAKGYDNFLSRASAEEEEMFIKGLHFCGGFGSYLAGFASTYMNGEKVALKTYEECSK